MINTKHLFDMTVAISSPLSSATPSGRRATVITEGGTIHGDSLTGRVLPVARSARSNLALSSAACSNCCETNVDQNRRSLSRFLGGALNGASNRASNWESSGCFGSFNR